MTIQTMKIAYEKSLETRKILELDLDRCTKRVSLMDKMYSSLKEIESAERNYPGRLSRTNLGSIEGCEKCMATITPLWNYFTKETKGKYSWNSTVETLREYLSGVELSIIERTLTEEQYEFLSNISSKELFKLITGEELK